VPTTFGAATFSGDVTVDSTTFHVDSTNNKVGIGTSDPKSIFHVGVGDADLRIGAVNYSGTSLNTTTYGLERSRNQILFSTWRDAMTDKIGAKISGINKQTYGSSTLRHLIQSTDLAFYTVPPDQSDYDNTVERLRITDTGNVGIGKTDPGEKLDVNGNLNVVGSYKSDGKTVQRTLIGYEKYTSSTSVIYATGVTGYQNPWSVTYTRVHSGSEIYIIGDLCLAQALGATGTTSYRGIYGRLRVNSGGVDYYSDSTYDWQRIDNSFHEYQRQSRVHFNQQALSGTTAGQTMTIYAQVDEGGLSGTRTSWGLNIWAGRSFIEVFEVM